MSTQHLPLQLHDTVVFAEVTVLGGEEKVSSTLLQFDALRPTLVELGQNVMDVVSQIGPDKATVEFGVELAVESGKLTALLAKGTTKANLTLTLSWGK